jgi:hypothetical protein
MAIGLVSDGSSASRQAIASACWSALWTKIAERYWQRRKLSLRPVAFRFQRLNMPGPS